MTKGRGRLIYITNKGEQEILPDDYRFPSPEPEPEPEIRQIRKLERFMPARSCPDREKRRSAWKGIFTELEAHTLSDRLAVARRLISMIELYRYSDERSIDRRGAKKRDREQKKRMAAALKLAKVIEENPEDDLELYISHLYSTGKYVSRNDGTVPLWRSKQEMDWINGLVATLHAIAGTGWRDKTFKKLGENTHQMPFARFHHELASFYNERTGRGIKRSVNPYTFEPQGPYVRFLQSVLDLIGEERDVEHAIRVLREPLPNAGQKLG